MELSAGAKLSFPGQNKKKYVAILLHESEEFILTFGRDTMPLQTD